MNGPPSNPPSGTVVDDVVTLPERYDFFLVSQSVRQGTVNPTSYNVIKDTSGLKPDHLQVSFIPFITLMILLFPCVEADLQADPPLLQLARHCEGASTLPVRTQASLPGWGELAQAAQRAAGGHSLLPLNQQDVLPRPTDFYNFYILGRFALFGKCFLFLRCYVKEFSV